MIKFDIILHPDQKLKRICTPVAEVTDEIRKIALRMIKTMYEAPGVGLAAPQVGILKRIFVMDCADKESVPDPHIMINPEIVWVSEQKNTYEEGCLSIPDFYGDVERPSEIKIWCLNENGIPTEHHFDALRATCAQHEIDHLNGILFIDYLGPIRKQIITSKMKKYKKENIRKHESLGNGK